jgi:cell division protein ZapA (FtsZ GTPase activity inhibitor)
MADAMPVHVAADLLRIKQVEQQISALRTSVICAFNQLLDLKDLNTGVHSTRLAEWGMRSRIWKLPRSCTI